VVDSADPQSCADAQGWTAIPLEIGHTDASRTWLHLVESGALARWPYGSTRLFVLETRPRFCLSRALAEDWFGRHGTAAE
jgi:hypothetical protein